MNLDSKIYVAGHTGLVGAALLRKLAHEGYTNIITAPRGTLDLRSQAEVFYFLDEEKPEYIFNASGRVGGILANDTYPAEFIFDNLQMELNLINASIQTGVKKFLYLGSSCIYPKNAPQPMKEEYLLSGALEKTNEPYAIAKIAGIILGQSYHRQYGMNIISLMPTNLYGINDNFSLNSSHVLPALIRKFHDAKTQGNPVVLWGTGTPKREFLFVDDLADACVFLMNNYDDPEIINVGTEEDLSIKELADMVKKVVGYEGEVLWDPSKPDGHARKLLDCSKLHKAGWRHKTPLEVGLQVTYDFYAKH